METARNAAKQGGAYGGDVKRELEYRLEENGAPPHLHEGRYREGG